MRCVRCRKVAAKAGGYCDSCATAVKAEVESGWTQLVEYLSRWAEFADWCAARGYGEATARPRRRPGATRA